MVVVQKIKRNFTIARHMVVPMGQITLIFEDYLCHYSNNSNMNLIFTQITSGSTTYLRINSFEIRIGVFSGAHYWN